MSKTDKSVEILAEVLQTSKIIGPEKTRQAIIDARSNSKYLDKSLGDLIKKTVAKTFKISQEKLLKGTSKGIRTDALMVAYVIAKKHLDYRLSDIAILFEKDESNISKSITAFNRLNPNNSQHKFLLDNYEKINIVVSDFIKSNVWQAGNP